MEYKMHWNKNKLNQIILMSKPNTTRKLSVWGKGEKIARRGKGKTRSLPSPPSPWIPQHVLRYLILVITKGYGVRGTTIEGQNGFAPALCFA